MRSSDDAIGEGTGLRPDSTRSRWAWIMGISLAVTGLLVLAGLMFLTPRCDPGTCPSPDELESYRPDEPAQVYDADGELAGSLEGPRRIVVPLESIPTLVREGYIAVEDRRFREHGGVDLTGGLRALATNLRRGGVEEGASTITMQLARNVYGPEVMGWNRWRRKLAEIRLARQIESQLDKDRILELYLNQIYLGDGVYGVETAARHYLGKSVGEVTPRQAAFLIGLAKNPEGYDPREHPEQATTRIETVLDILEGQGILTAEEARDAREVELELTSARVVRQEWGTNAYYFAAVRRRIREILPEPAQRAGVRIHTGLDQRAQAAAVEALGTRIRQVEQGQWGYFPHEAAPDSISRAEGLSPYLQGMVVALQPEDGLVTTLVGGRDYRHSEFDRAFQARRQPGSAFKPIVYAAALSGGLRLSEPVSTEPVRFTQRGSQDWQPRDHVSGGELTVREALVRSSNTATARIGDRIGVERVRQQARTLGLSSDIPSYPAIFLGAAEVVPVELVAAYAAFGNGGRTVEPHLITRVEDADGQVLYRHEPVPATRALDSGVAFLVLDVLRDVVTRGTGWRVGASGLSWPAAGKTGTTNESRDLWFVGMTPALVAGVWIGFDEPREVVDDIGGGDIAAPAWASFMQAANRGRGPMEPWRPPAGVTQVRIHVPTGQALSEDCPVRGDVRTEYFLTGSAPMPWCPVGRESDGGWWGGDSLGWVVEDTLRDTLRGDTLGRDTLLRDDALERRRRALERQQRLDSLQREIERRRTRRDTLRRDTLRRDTLRPDTARPDTIRPDTIRPDTIRPDTIDTIPPPRRTGGGASPGNSRRDQAPAETFEATSRAGAPGPSPATSASIPPWASHRSASRAAMHPVPAAVTAWR